MKQAEAERKRNQLRMMLNPLISTAQDDPVIVESWLASSKPEGAHA
jgi:hypothetical protein